MSLQQQQNKFQRLRAHQQQTQNNLPLLITPEQINRATTDKSNDNTKSLDKQKPKLKAKPELPPDRQKKRN